MPRLNDGNSSVDKSSGAVIFQKSPELLEIMRLKEEIKKLDVKMDNILSLLQGGEGDGTKVDK